MIGDNFKLLKEKKNLINGNVIYNNNLIYYTGNHKYYLYIYVHTYYFCSTKSKKYIFSQKNTNFLKNSKGMLAKILIFLIKVIYNILRIIKNYIKFEKIFF